VTENFRGSSLLKVITQKLHVYGGKTAISTVMESLPNIVDLQTEERETETERAREREAEIERERPDRSAKRQRVR